MPCLPPAHSPSITAAIYPWRIGGKLHLTWVAKCTYNWVHGGPMSLATPEPIRAADETHGNIPTKSVAFPAETALHLPSCDVVFKGCVHIASGTPAATAAARLGIFAGGKALIDKTIHAVGDRVSGAAPTPFLTMPVVYERALGGIGLENPVGAETPNLFHPNDPRKPIGFGPISRFWRTRKTLLTADERAQLESAEPSLSEGHSWAYHQAAPPDQQVPYLRGGEWIVLDGLHPTLTRVQTQIPPHRAVACLRVPGQPPVETALVADMLILDGDRQVAHVVFRGHIPFSFGDAELTTAQSAVALAESTAPPSWDHLFAAASVSTQPTPGTASKAAPGIEETLTLSGPAMGMPPQNPVTPFQVKEAGARRLSPDVRATPWSALPIQRIEGDVGETTLGAPAAPSSRVSTVVTPPIPSASPGEPTPFYPIVPNADLPTTLPQPSRIDPPSKPVPRQTPSPRVEAIVVKPTTDNKWTPPPPVKRKPKPNAAKLPASELAATLRGIGAASEDISSFLLAIDPPPPPDDPEDS